MRIDEILGGVQFFESVLHEITQESDEYFENRINEIDDDDVFSEVGGGDDNGDDVFSDYEVTEVSEDDVFSEIDEPDEDNTYGGAAEYMTSLVKSYNNYGS